MKRRYKVISVWMLFFILFNLGLTACDSKPPDDSSAYDPMTPPDLSVIASPYPYQLQWDWLHYPLVRISPGWFALGADPAEDPLLRGDETPQKNTYEPGFWMGEREVTNKEYALCVEAGVCSLPSIRETGPTNHFSNPTYDNHPVVGVNWFQAQGYCEWTKARLATEAEWEKAARGTMGYIYPWGNDPPTCDHANAKLPGCEGEGDTLPTGAFPWESRTGLFDMAGNVKEWTFDWYAPDAYLTVTAFMPTGPAEGDKKVVRGGGFNDFKENLRTTARWGYAPDQDFDDVGFRCVPVTPSYATFCEPSYVPLCYNPDIPKSDDPCVPGENVPGDEGVTLLGFGCPMNKIVCFQFSTNGGGSNGYSALVEEDAFTCGPLDERPDIVECCGPEQPMGRNVEITICAPGGSPEGAPVSTTALNATSGIMLAGFNTSGIISLIRTTAPNCPDGYIYDPETGDCILNKQRTACPENWIYDWRLGECVPDQNRGDDCPPGYFINTDINCCEPIPPDNYGCPDGYFWHATYEKCVPIDDYNCGYGTTFNGYGECDQNPYMPGPANAPEGDCPPGLFLAAANTCDLQEDGYSSDNPFPGTGLRPGDQIGPDGLVTPELGPAHPECPEGYYYHGKYERCLERDSDGCPISYYFDRETKRCVPTNGPSSPCPPGYVYNSRIECCVPEPGWDSTRCSQDAEHIPGTSFQEMPVDPYDSNQGKPFDPFPYETNQGKPFDPFPYETNQEMPIDPYGSNQEMPIDPYGSNQAMPIDPYGTTDFDPVSGRCENGDRTRKSGKPENCPPGLLITNVGTCDQYPPDGVGVPPDPCKDLKDPKLCQAACPEEYWSQEANTCDYPEPECGVNEYFDRRLGYCITLQNDCCEIGQDYSVLLKECVDVVANPWNGECQDGFELIDGLCWLIGRTEGQGGMCWTITRNTPRCIGPCEVGQVYNEATGRCEEPSDPCANVNCYSIYPPCPSNCCKQVDTSRTCVPK